MRQIILILDTERKVLAKYPEGIWYGKCTLELFVVVSAVGSRFFAAGEVLQALTSLETLRLRFDPVDPHISSGVLPRIYSIKRIYNQIEKMLLFE
jgi:hypothetical protein